MERFVDISPELIKRLPVRKGFFAYFRKEYVQVFSVSGENTVFRMTEIFRSPFTQKETSSFVKQLLASNILSLHVILSRDFFVCKRVVLPAADFREAKKMAFLKLPKLSPYSPEDSVSEVSFVEKKDRDYTTVNLWIISRNILYRYLYLLNKAGIAVNALSLDIDGISSLWSSPQEKDSCIMAVLVDQSCVHLLITRGKFILHSRMITSALSEDKEICRNNVMKESENFLRYVREEYPEDTPGKMIVFPEQAPFLAAEDHIGNIPVLKTSWADLDFTPSPDYQDFPVQVITSAFAGGNMNFITDRYRNILSHMSLIRKSIKVISMVIIFTLCLFVIIAMRYSKKSDAIHQLQGRLNEIEKESSSIKVLQERILSARKIEKSQAAFLDVLNTVIPLIKGSMRLSSFSMDENSQVEISGHAGTLKDVNDFTGALQGRPSFQKVKPEQIMSMKLDNRDVYTFKINFFYSPYQEEE